MPKFRSSIFAVERCAAARHQTKEARQSKSPRSYPYERCPDYIDTADWQQAIVDGRRFLGRWGEQAASLGWTARDLFGLPRIPEKPAPNYPRLSRYDETGLIWLLRGRPVVALSDATAAIEQPTGAVTIYRKNNKPALGPVGDSLDDINPSGWQP